MNFTFVAASPAALSAMRAAGFKAEASPPSPVEFAVGDFICFPSAPGLTFRVAYRLCQLGDSPCWLLGLEPAQDPTTQLPGQQLPLG